MILIINIRNSISSKPNLLNAALPVVTSVKSESIIESIAHASSLSASTTSNTEKGRRKF